MTKELTKPWWRDLRGMPGKPMSQEELAKSWHVRHPWWAAVVFSSLVLAPAFCLGIYEGSVGSTLGFVLLVFGIVAGGLRRSRLTRRLQA